MRNIITDEVGAGDLYQTIKYQYRNGFPTRKYKKYLSIMRKCDLDSDEQMKIINKYLS